VVPAIKIRNQKSKMFQNENPDADRSLREVLRWARTRQPKPWPRWVEHRVRYEPRVPRSGELLVTFVNHATFLIQGGSYDAADGQALNILTDPVWVHRAFPVQWAGPARVHAPGVPFNQLPRIDVVLLSHNHYDHMDLATLRRLQERFNSLIITTLGNKAYLEARGLRDVIELGWWQTVDGTTPVAADLEVGPIEITATPAQHFAARTPFDRNRTLWAGFALTLGGRRLFFTGDSGYHTHFTEIGRRLGPFDVTLVPIGAYEPRWFMSAAHMNPDEAVRAHLDLRSRLSIAMHFGCFQLTDEAIDEPVQDLQRALGVHGVDPSTFRVLEPGETLVL
jgi:L-ascorbate metabolism protein UlaG (beta-lactamase superfamily)